MPRRSLFEATEAKLPKRNGKVRAGTVEFWYRRKYSLTANDPRYLDTTPEEMMTDYWAHYYFDNPKALEEVEDDDFDVEAELARAEAEADEQESVLPNDFVDVNE